MALVKFYNGNTENLDNLPIKEGQIIFSVSNSNGSIYYDSSNSSRIKMTALADRAVADNLGNNIGNTYISNLTGTTSKTNYVITPKTASGNNKTAITIPAASSTIAGLMTTESQTFSGNKTFNQTVTFLGNADAALGSYTYPAVTIGPYASAHIEMDANEIMAKGSANTAANLYLNNEGGVVDIGPGGMNIRGHITAGATTRTLDIGSANNYFRNVYGTNFYGTATNASQLSQNSVLSYTSNTLRYFNISSPVGTAADANNVPTNAWWHILRFIRADGNKFYTDLAIPFTDNSIYYKRIAQGGVANTSNTALKGWVKVLDEINYSSVIDNRYVNVTGDTMTGYLNLTATGNGAEGGELVLKPATQAITKGAVHLDNYDSTFRIFGGPSADGTTLTGTTTPLVINPRAKTITGNYTITGTLNGNASSATLLKPHNSNITYQSSSWNSVGSFVWGMSFKDSSLGGDPGDIVLSLVKYSDTQNTLNLSIDGQINAGSVRTDRIGFIGNLQGNATTASTLQTARSINGTSFNGSANITTNIWGATRTLTIGKKANSVNGSSNVTWNLWDIGALSVQGDTWAVTLGGGDGNTTGYRLIGTATMAAWQNWRSVLLVSSRHTGNGIYTLAYGNNSNTIDKAHAYCQINYFGNATGGDIISFNSIQCYISNDGKTLYFFYRYYDYDAPSISCLAKYVGAFIPVNDGAWMTSINEDIYGTLLATTNINVATKLQTARTINGTAFDGTANITTTNWGSTRNFYIADASAAHTGSAVSVNGSSNVTLKLPSTITATLNGTASNAYWLYPDNRLTLGASGLQYFNLDGDGGTSPTVNNTPTSAWYHILRMNHANGKGYYADIAVPLNDTAGIYWRQIRSGTNYGWFKLLDSSNYTNYTVTKTGSGAFGTWGINVTGNAGTATKLQTTRTIRTNLSSTSTASFNGTADITPGITGTLAISHGGTGATTASGACNNLGAVTISTSQTITGTKTFTANPVIQTTYYPSIILQPTNVTTVKGVIEASYVGSVFLDSYNSASGDYRRRLVINSTRSQSNIANALQLGDYKEGTDTRYMIYSQANLKYSSTEPSSPVSGMIWLKPV